AVCDADFYVYAFDTIAYAIQCRSANLKDWEAALRGIKAEGGTSIGVSFRMMMKAEQVVEQIVLVTDGGENTAPYFDQEYEKYEQKFAVRPHVVMVRVPGESDVLGGKLKAKSISYDRLEVGAKSDYYAQPTLLVMLSQPSRADLLIEVMTTPLPTRKDP